MRSLSFNLTELGVGTSQRCFHQPSYILANCTRSPSFSCKVKPFVSSRRNVRSFSGNGRSVLDKYTSHVFQSLQDKATLGLPEVAGIERPVARVQPVMINAALYIGAPLVANEKKPEDNTELQLQEVLRALAQVEKRNSNLRQDMQDVTQKLAATALDLQAKLQQRQSPPADSTRRSPVPATDCNGERSSATQGTQLEARGFVPASIATSCVVQHPGAVCCTEVSVVEDPETEFCTLTVQTVARRVEDQGTPSLLNEDSLLGLAAQALVNAANDVNHRQTQHIQESSHNAEWSRQHHEIQEILKSGNVVNVRRSDVSEFGHESFLVELEDRKTKRRIKALFKPRVPGDSDGWHRVPIELVAYELNLLLGMDYVPPVAYRTGGVDVNYQHFEEGAFIYYSESAQTLSKVPEHEWSVRKDMLLSDTRILDVLLHNSDRHHGHFLMGEHWVEGKWENGKWMGARRPILIDHAAGFRPEADVTLEHENAFQTGPVRCISAKTYLRLRFLDAATITSKFGKWLDEKEMRGLLHRRNYVLKCMDRMVMEHGYMNTVVEM